MASGEATVASFLTYLRRVLGDSETVVHLGDDDPLEAAVGASIVVATGTRPEFAGEHLPHTTLGRRFANWGEGAEAVDPRDAVAIYDRFDPRAVGAVPDDYTVLALITTFNEEDVIEQLIDRLAADAIAIHVVDNWSTDGTYPLLARYAAAGVLTFERFPAEGPSGWFELEVLLGRVEELAHRSGADWVVHHDADEIRESPWPGVSLRKALWAVAGWGFNCVDHAVLNFRPITDSWQPREDLASSFTHVEFADGPAQFVQLKAWQPQRELVTMAATGGHDAAFAGRRVFPYKFLNRHYPIRSQAHGERKLLRERRNRFSPAERAKGWHTHYDHYGEDSSFLFSKEDLLEYATIDRDHLLARLSGVGLFTNPWPGEGPPADLAGRLLEASAYCAVLRLVAPHVETAAAIVSAPGAVIELDVEVTNTGTAVFRRGGRNDIGLSSRWFSEETAEMIGEGTRARFASDLPPGGRAVVTLLVQAPAAAGRYRLDVDLVHEYVRWFDCAISLPVEVT